MHRVYYLTKLHYIKYTQNMIYIKYNTKINSIPQNNIHKLNKVNIYMNMKIRIHINGS